MTLRVSDWPHSHFLRCLLNNCIIYGSDSALKGKGADVLDTVITRMHGAALFCLGAGRGRRKKSGWGRAGQGREQNPRGGPRTVEPYQGILRVGQKDRKPISSGQCLFFNKYDFFCLFFIHHLVHFLSGSTGRAWRGVHPWIILLRLLLNYTWLLDYKSTSVYSVSSILIHLTWKINFIKRSGKYSIASAHAWNCNRTKRLLLWVSFAWRGTHGGFFAIDY